MLFPWYRPSSFYLLRTPIFSLSLFHILAQSERIEPSDEQDIELAWHHALQTSVDHFAQLATHPVVEQALLLASPSLYEALHKPYQQKDITDRRTLHIYGRLLRYLIRMSSRPTPFGYCAGVAFGTFASESHVFLERFEGAGIRPDMRWLLTLLHEVEPRLLSSLKIQVMPALFTLGKRGIGFRRNKEGQQDERLWFKLTPIVQQVCQYARMPIFYADLKQALHTDFPQVQEEHIDTLLHELYTISVLVTTLPPSNEHDPLDSILTTLRSISDPSGFTTRLEALRQTLPFATQNAHTLAALIQHQQALTPRFEGTTLQVDTRIHLRHNTLSHTIGLEAAKGAETLLRLGMYPYGLPTLHRARNLFLERYEQQEVPVLALFTPQGGLEDLYTTEQEMDLGDLPQPQQRKIRQRAHLLRTLAMQAINAQEESITLTPELVERLSLWSSSENITLPPLLDLYMQIYAPSTEAIDHGDWRGLITLLPIGGRSYRRFLHLFGEQEQAMVRDLLVAGDNLHPDHLRATLAIIPPNTRDLNVMHGPQWSHYIIPINRSTPYSPEQTILPDDLFVSVRQGRFLIRSKTHNKAVRITQPHMLSFTHLPPLARFLLEASQDSEPYPGAFQWGNAGGLPFLPRLVQGKIIISPAQWTLSPTLFNSKLTATNGAQWFQAFQRWRNQWHVPRHIYLTEGEDRLLLDLEHPFMVEILRQEYARTSKANISLTLQEAFSREGEGWLRDQKNEVYCSEIVIPLIRTTVSPQPSVPMQAPHVIAHEERQFLPGQEWLYLKLYLPEGLHQTLLAHQLLPFIQKHRSLFELWFFLRYHDPQAHIRLRFLSSDTQQRNHLLQALLAWSHELRAEGLLTRCVLDTYERETERYGGPEAMKMIEHVFCANSEAICALLARQHRTYPPLFEAVYALDRLWHDWGYPLTTHYQTLQPLLSPDKESHAMRQQRQALLAFLIHPPEDIADIFRQKQSVLAQAGSAIRQLAEQDKLWQREEEILLSLSHLLCNRLLGTQRTHEAEAYTFWYTTLKTRYHSPSRREA